MSPPKPTQRPLREHRWSTTENARLGAATCSPRSGRTAGVAEKSSLRSGPRPAPEQLGAQSPAIPAGVFRGALRLTTIGLLIAVRLVAFEAMAIPTAMPTCHARRRPACWAKALAVKGEPAPSNRHDQLYTFPELRRLLVH